MKMSGFHLALVLLWSGLLGIAAVAADWPVVTLAYDGSLGSAETEEGELEAGSYRHQLTLRVRERWSRDLSATLEGTLTRRLYPVGVSGSPYLAVGAEPTLRLGIADGLRCILSMQARRMLYDGDVEPGADAKSYSRLRAGADFTIDLAKGLSLTPRAQATFDLYDDATRTRQSYTFGMGLDAKLGQLALGADYRGVARVGLGGLSVVEDRLDHSFGVDLTWDPND